MALTLGAALGLAAGTTAFNFIAGRKQADDAYDQSKEASALAYERSREGYKRRYQDTMEDMKLAGLNPILAASSGGFNVGTAPQMQPAKAFQAPPVNFGSSAKDVTSSVKQTEESKLTIQKTAEARAKKGLIKQQEENALKEYFNLQQQFNKITAEAKHTLAKRDLAVEEKKRVILAAQQLKANLVKLKQLAKVYKGPTGHVMTYVQEILKSLNLGIAVVPGLKRR